MFSSSMRCGASTAAAAEQSLLRRRHGATANAADQTLHCSSWPAGEFQEIVQRSMPALSTSRVDSIFMRPALSGWKLSISAPSRIGSQPPRTRRRPHLAQKHDRRVPFCTSCGGTESQPPIAYIGRGGATNRALLISWPSHFASTLARIAFARSSSPAPPRSNPFTSISSIANRQ